MTAVHVVGMHGLGDNLHQRALVGSLSARHEVWLETPWPNVYHDLNVRFLRPARTLRTQSKNCDRNASLYTDVKPPANALQIRPWYTPERVRALGSVLGAMTYGFECDDDFRLPVPLEWRQTALEMVERWRPDRPIVIYRPLVERTEWGGCSARNPEHSAYATLFRSIRDRFFVVSIADLVPGREWIVGEEISADVTFHRGELSFETIAALTAMAGLVFCSPGFMAPLSQAVGTPLACVFGGYESGRSFSAGAKWAPYLPIEPIRPCECFSHRHACDKRIDLPRAISRLQSFIDETSPHPAVEA